MVGHIARSVGIADVGHPQPRGFQVTALPDRYVEARQVILAKGPRADIRQAEVAVEMSHDPELDTDGYETGREHTGGETSRIDPDDSDHHDHRQNGQKELELWLDDHGQCHR